MPAAYRGVKLAVYNSAELKQGLGSRYVHVSARSLERSDKANCHTLGCSQTFSQAVQELEVVVGHFEHLQKDTQVAAVADLRTAVEYQERYLPGCHKHTTLVHELDVHTHRACVQLLGASGGTG